MILEVTVGSWILVSVLQEAMEVLFEVFDVLYILRDQLCLLVLRWGQEKKQDDPLCGWFCSHLSGGVTAAWVLIAKVERSGWIQDL